MARQQTIKHPVSVTGKGLHSGKPVQMCLKPAPSDTGIVFRRVDLEPPVDIRVDARKIEPAPLCTLLVDHDVKVATIEHLMAALATLEIDNIIVELDAAEVPVMDGSSAPLIFILESAGIRRQQLSRHVIEVKKPVRVEDGDCYAELLPSKELRFTISIDFEHPAIASTSQSIDFIYSPMAFIKEVSRARTFGFLKDLKKLHKQGLALGGGLDNAVGLDDKKVMNPEGLRYSDEFVKHKLLDAVGDLYVAGPILGHYQAHKPSHRLNNQLIQKLLRSYSAWRETS